MNAPLTHATELDLAFAARTGDSAARERLICEGLPWVAMHAARLGLTGSRYDDAIQDGCVGLIDAVDRFDPTRGTRLVSFAWPWIEGAMRRGRRHSEVALSIPHERAASPSQSGGSIEVPDDAVLRLRFGFHDGRVWTRAEVANCLGWSPAQVRQHELRVLARLRERVASIGLRAHS